MRVSDIGVARIAEYAAIAMANILLWLQCVLGGGEGISCPWTQKDGNSHFRNSAGWPW